jgi:hypothetical protein
MQWICGMFGLLNKILLHTVGFVASSSERAVIIVMSAAPAPITFSFYILFFPFAFFFVTSGVWESHGHVLVEPACQSCVEIKKNQSAYISHFLFIHAVVSEWNSVNVSASYSFIRCNDFIAFRNKLYVLLPFSTRSRAVLYWSVCWFCAGKLPTNQLCFDVRRQ